MKRLTPAIRFELERQLLNDWFDTLPPDAERDLSKFEKWRKERLKQLGIKD